MLIFSLHHPPGELAKLGLSFFRHLHGVEITTALLEEAGDFLLSQTVDIHFVVELGDGKDLLLLVEFLGCCPPDELFALMGIIMFKDIFVIVKG